MVLLRASDLTSNSRPHPLQPSRDCEAQIPHMVREPERHMDRLVRPKFLARAMANGSPHPARLPSRTLALAAPGPELERLLSLDCHELHAIAAV